MHLLHRLRHEAEDPTINIVSKFDRLPNCNADRNHPHIYLVLPRQSQSGNYAGSVINQVSIRARGVGIGIKHEDRGGEDTAKVTVDAENLW